MRGRCLAPAAVTSRVELGPLVLCSSFRDPGVVAKMAATLDEVSAGRLVLGLGAGWHDPEYEAFGFPTGHRVSRFAEALEIVARLLRRERVSFEGRYYRLSEAELLPAEASHPDPGGREKTTNAPVDGTLGRRLEHGVVRGAERQAARRNGGARAGARRHRAAAELQRTLGIIIGSDPADTIARRLDTWAKLGFDHVVAEVEPITPESVERLGSGVRLFRGA